MMQKCPICQKEYKMRKIVEEIIKDFPEKKDKWIEMECPNSNMHFKILRDREIANIPKETKQKVLDLIHEGKTVGDVCKILNLETMIVAEIIIQNIGTVSYLKTEVEA